MGLRKKKSPLEQAKGQASDLADTVLPVIGSAYESARKSAAPVLEDARDRATALAEEARSSAAPYVDDARDKAAPYVKDAKKRAKKARKQADPYLKDARKKAKPYVEDARKSLDEARTRAEPVIAEGKAAVAERASVGAAYLAAKADEGSGLVDGKAKALRKEAKRSRGGRLKKLLLLAALAGVGAVVYSRMKDSGQDNWQSSYTPTPPPAAPAPKPDPAAPAAASEDDTAGADPAEAASDAGEQPHPVTDPDAPATSVDVDDPKD